MPRGRGRRNRRGEAPFIRLSHAPNGLLAAHDHASAALRRGRGVRVEKAHVVVPGPCRRHQLEAPASCSGYHPRIDGTDDQTAPEECRKTLVNAAIRTPPGVATLDTGSSAHPGPPPGARRAPRSIVTSAAMLAGRPPRKHQVPKRAAALSAVRSEVALIGGEEVALPALLGKHHEPQWGFTAGCSRSPSPGRGAPRCRWVP